MAWKYKAGISLLLTVVIIWVTSAEVTQKIFEAYRQPFVLTYLGASLMVIYLPVSMAKDWMYSRFRKRYRRMERENSDVDVDVHRNGFVESPSKSSDCTGMDQFMFQDVETGEEKAFVTRKEQQWTDWEVAKICLYLAPLWLVTEYLSNAALAQTSVASTTILASTSALFTLLFGVLLGQDQLSILKILSVLLTIIGVAMTTLGSTWASGEEKPKMSKPSEHDLVGDVLGLLSAVAYGLFTVSLKKIAGEEGESVDVQKIFGYIGLFTLVGLWWLAIPLHAFGLEPKFTIPSSAKIDEALLANGFIGSVLSDYIWALSVVWTTPLVATLGMSLTIPVAMLADMFVHGRHYSAIYILGSAQVFAGFMVANLTEQCSRKLGF